jgi:hypothetical protein
VDAHYETQRDKPRMRIENALFIHISIISTLLCEVLDTFLVTFALDEITCPRF